MSFARWATAFAFTQVVEVPIYRYGLRCRFWHAFGASALTHPLVWTLVVEAGWRASWTTRTSVGEAVAVLVEALYFGHAFGWRRALAWSLVANGTSFALGLFAYALTAP